MGGEWQLSEAVREPLDPRACELESLATSNPRECLPAFERSTPSAESFEIWVTNLMASPAARSAW
jgi:hypothetical protein